VARTQRPRPPRKQPRPCANHARRSPRLTAISSPDPRRDRNVRRLRCEGPPRAHFAWCVEPRVRPRMTPGLRPMRGQPRLDGRPFARAAGCRRIGRGVFVAVATSVGSCSSSREKPQLRNRANREQARHSARERNRDPPASQHDPHERQQARVHHNQGHLLAGPTRRRLTHNRSLH
jgi:hypothetical protein